MSGFISAPYLAVRGSQPTAPTFVSAGTVDAQAGTANPGLPAGHTTNDILIIVAFAVGNSGTAITTPTGYTLIDSQTSGLVWRLSIYYKRDGGSEAAPAVSLTLGTGIIARMLCFRGCTTSDPPVDQSAKASAAAGTSLTMPAITTTVSNSMVINTVGGPGPNSSGTTEYSGWTNANLASIIEATDDAAAVGGGASIGSAYGVLSGTGNSGQTTATSVTSQTHGYLTFNLIGA